MSEEIAHVDDEAPGDLRVGLAQPGRDGVGGLPDRLYPVDHSREQDFVLDQFLLGFGAVTLDL